MMITGIDGLTLAALFFSMFVIAYIAAEEFA